METNYELLKIDLACCLFLLKEEKICTSLLEATLHVVAPCQPKNPSISFVTL